MTYISNFELAKIMPLDELIYVARRYSNTLLIRDFLYTEARFDKKWLKYVSKIADHFGVTSAAVERRLKILAKEDDFYPEMLFKMEYLWKF